MRITSLRRCNLQTLFDAPRAIGSQVVEVQALWKEIYNFGAEFSTDDRQ